ncbi:4F2 cell-surface antigen heavy chain isoform X1 [Notechis scutatus]|uniref:4F2 cell-surface antigen heavy chain isoform X1 n=2 Tax=Notechis scutatus TaxID=8663 RepID=A0A6J1VWV7_9SAUR|nr:4F2 cell-surface antigen heavy chain isoform X1 [Notechis scutatus]
MAAPGTGEIGGGETPMVIQERADPEREMGQQGSRGDSMSSPAVTPELDMKDVELNEMDPEKQPMNASSPLAGSPGSLGEKNGVVKVKMEEEEEEAEMAAKFTGLSKEQLLQVAGTPGWVRTRWALLILFWLGWLGMLAGAIAIIVQAPRCRDLPKQDWWQKGGIYRIREVEGFQDSGSDGIGDLTGVKERMNYLSTLKVKGFVIGPLHVNLEDQPYSTNLQDVDPKLGTLQDFRDVLQAAKKKNIKVILDLTPNYHGQLPWFSRDVWLQGDFQNKMKEAIQFWLSEGVSGIQIGSVEHLNDSQLLSEWKNITEQDTVDDQARVLIAMTSRNDARGIFSLMNETTGVDMLTSQYLQELVKPDQNDTTTLGHTAQKLIKDYLQEAGSRWPSWSMGRPYLGHLAKSMGEQLLRLHHLLFYTLPGTPFTDFGDEIGLWDMPGEPAASNVTHMQWDNSATYGFSRGAQQLAEPEASNITVQAQQGHKGSILSFFQELSELRTKERSLLHGDFALVQSLNSSVFSYLRVWDQNKRFLVVLNFARQERTVSLVHSHLPSQVDVELSTHPSREERQLNLQNLKLLPSEGLLLSFPYMAH